MQDSFERVSAFVLLLEGAINLGGESQEARAEEAEMGKAKQADREEGYQVN